MDFNSHGDGNFTANNRSSSSNSGAGKKRATRRRGKGAGRGQVAGATPAKTTSSFGSMASGPSTADSLSVNSSGMVFNDSPRQRDEKISVGGHSTSIEASRGAGAEKKVPASPGGLSLSSTTSAAAKSAPDSSASSGTASRPGDAVNDQWPAALDSTRGNMARKGTLKTQGATPTTSSKKPQGSSISDSLRPRNSSDDDDVVAREQERSLQAMASHILDDDDDDDDVEPRLDDGVRHQDEDSVAFSKSPGRHPSRHSSVSSLFTDPSHLSLSPSLTGDEFSHTERGHANAQQQPQQHRQPYQSSYDRHLSPPAFGDFADWGHSKQSSAPAYSSSTSPPSHWTGHSRLPNAQQQPHAGLQRRQSIPDQSILGYPGASMTDYFQADHGGGSSVSGRQLSSSSSGALFSQTGRGAAFGPHSSFSPPPAGAARDGDLTRSLSVPQALDHANRSLVYAPSLSAAAEPFRPSSDDSSDSRRPSLSSAGSQSRQAQYPSMFSSPSPAGGTGFDHSSVGTGPSLHLSSSAPSQHQPQRTPLYARDAQSSLSSSNRSINALSGSGSAAVAASGASLPGPSTSSASTARSPPSPSSSASPGPTTAWSSVVSASLNREKAGSNVSHGVVASNMEDSRTLFVRNLPSEVDDKELRSIFEPFGSLRSFYSQNRSGGFVLITYHDLRHARRALSCLNGKQLRQSIMQIDFSEPKDNPAEAPFNVGAILVAGLHQRVSNKDFLGLCTPFGVLREVRDGVQTGLRYVEYFDSRDAEAAAGGLNGLTVLGQRLSVEIARPGYKQASRVVYHRPDLDERQFPPSHASSTRRDGGDRSLMSQSVPVARNQWSASSPPNLSTSPSSGSPSRSAGVPLHHQRSRQVNSQQRQNQQPGSKRPDPKAKGRADDKSASSSSSSVPVIGSDSVSSETSSSSSISGSSALSNSGRMKASGPRAGSKSSSSSGNSGSGSSGRGQNAHFILDIDRIKQGLESRTALMIRNIPNKYTQQMLLGTLREHLGPETLFDFFYLPIDFKNKCNVGYAFINFIEPLSTALMFQRFHGKRWPRFNSEKICAVTYARIQGKRALMQHFENSSLMREDAECRPLIFHSDGPLVGQPQSFPVQSSSAD